jgi:hypothetical protein
MSEPLKGQEVLKTVTWQTDVPFFPFYIAVILLHTFIQPLTD